jgi:hypothetical protein
MFCIQIKKNIFSYGSTQFSLDINIIYILVLFYSSIAFRIKFLVCFGSENLWPEIYQVALLLITSISFWNYKSHGRLIGFFGWVIGQSQGLCLQNITQMQKKENMPIIQMGFGPTIPVFQWTLQDLDNVATAIGINYYYVKTSIAPWVILNGCMLKMLQTSSDHTHLILNYWQKFWNYLCLNLVSVAS